MRLRKRTFESTSDLHTPCIRGEEGRSCDRKVYGSHLWVVKVRPMASPPSKSL